MRSIVWFRNDLRVNDNTALHAATRPGQSTGGCVALFVIAPSLWERHDYAPVRVDFILRNLAILSRSLDYLNIPLRIIHAERESEIANLILGEVQSSKCGALHFNREYEVDEAARDARVTGLLESRRIVVCAHHDQVALSPGSVRTQENRPFSVFTPFKKRWAVLHAEQGGTPVLAPPAPQVATEVLSTPVPTCVAGFECKVEATLWPAGEDAAMSALRTFATERIDRYTADRDFPAIAATSRQSVSLATGVLSPRQCLAAAIEANGGKLDGGRAGPTQWISEMVWREFYVHVVAAFPRVCMHRAFKPETDRIAWLHDEPSFERWKTGTTGVPIVDAAMRQLNQTGWMHNRLRMVAAMYLTKDLFIDWRWGEKYFMRNLVDGFLASNNGGWQWSASTGTDAAPYFRIFNPVSQSRNYDPEGEFIRRFCPELAALDNRAIHEPYSDDHGVAPLSRTRLDYPEPIVDHRKARARVLAAFKAVGSASSSWG